MTRKLIHGTPKTFSATSGLRKDNVSFAKIVEGKRKSDNFSVDWLPLIKYQSCESERRWLEGCYTGHLKREFQWADYVGELEGECGGQMKLCPLGGNLLLIQASSNIPIKDLIEGFDEWSSFWFDWIRPWRETDVNQHRLVWTRWAGVPAHVWSNKFFLMACANLGLFMKLDSILEQKIWLDEARVLLSTTIMRKLIT